MSKEKQTEVDKVKEQILNLIQTLPSETSRKNVLKWIEKDAAFFVLRDQEFNREIVESRLE